MRVGDIIWVTKTYKARYGNRGGSYDYHFTPGHKYQITHCHGNSYSITNITTNDGVSHFAHSHIMDCFVSSEEWREMQLNKLEI